ncbi:MAG: aminodeoxychorismate lyase [Gammaproteobacteria bacterium]|nr:aminodeoxychorismate lyase [Gammaproteobacteria bacterium]
MTLINGRPGGHVSVQDRGFQYGDGLFETLAVVKGTPLLWERHVQRLFRGAQRLRIAAPAEALLRREAQTLCADADRAVLKIILTRGISERGYAVPVNAMPTRVLSLMPWPDYPAHHRTQGVSVQFCTTKISRQPALAGLKHLNRLEQVLARAELKPECSEGLMLDEQAHVIEGTMSNIFAVVGGKLATPDLSHSGVAGIMRDIVCERAAALALDCQVKTLTREDILTADEIFLSNSLIGIWPARRVESKEYPLGQLTLRMQEAIRDAHGAG